MWGIEADEPWEDLAANIYGVRFDCMSNSPGFVGDLYYLQGDHLVGPPLMLTRDKLVRGTANAGPKPLEFWHLCCEHVPPEMP
jgi:hypothetical protein